MKLKTVIYGSILAIALPLIAVSGFLMISWYLDSRDKAIATTASLAAIAADDFDRHIANLEVVLGVIARRRAIETLNPTSCDRVMDYIRDVDRAHVNLTLVNAAGTTICPIAANNGRPLPDVADREWFRRVMREDRFVISTPLTGRVTGSSVSILAYPVHDGQGDPIGAIALSHEMGDELADLPDIPADATIVIVTGTGEPVLRRSAADSERPQMVNDKILSAALDAAPGAGIGATTTGVEIAFGYRPIRATGWIVIAARPLDAILANIRSQSLWALSLLGTVLIGIFLIAGILGRWLVRQTEDVAATARALAAGQSDMRMAVPQLEEFATIARQFNAVLDVRDDAARRITKLNRLYAASSETSHAITKITDRSRLLDAVCRIAVEQGRFELVWIGFLDPEASMIVPAAHHGPASAYMGSLHISLDPNDPAGQGPTATAIRANRPEVISNFFTDDRMSLSRERARRYGFCSAAAVPVTEDGQPIGTMNLYSSEPGYFEDQELMSLIGQMVDDLSFALSALRRDALRRETEERFRQIAENVREVFWLTDLAKNRMLYISPAYREIWGQSPDELYASPANWLEAIHPDDRARVLEAAMTKQTSGDYDEEYRIVRPDGGVRWIHDRAFPIRDENDVVYRVAGVAEDITDRKSMEDSLRRSEANLVAAQTIAKLGSWSRDLVTGAGHWSAEMYRLFNRPPRSGDPDLEEFMSYVDPADRQRHRDTSRTVVETAREATVDFRGNPEKGPVRRFRTNITPIVDAAGKVVGLAGTVLDVTEIKEAEERLFQAQKMEALGNLAGGIAHDFNNMLLPILNLTEMAMEDLPEDHSVQENLALVVEAARRASQLVRQILAFGRRSDREVELLDVSDSIADALRLLRNVLPATITVIDRIESDVGRIEADASEIQSIILNLGSNAAHAMGGKPGRLTVGLSRIVADAKLIGRCPTLVVGRSYARIEIADTGHGMDVATMAKIFNPFFTTKPVGEGTGLGLSMVHGIIEGLAGAIEVASEPGVGTTFTIYLPLLTASPAR